MNKTDFIEQLRETAEVLKPLTRAVLPGAKIWNGSGYVRSEGRAEAPDPYALAWWTNLRTIADLIEAQESSVTPKQIAYLENVLFGGMGSLNDLSFRNADAINSRLIQKRRDLFASLKGI